MSHSVLVLDPGSKEEEKGGWRAKLSNGIVAKEEKEVDGTVALYLSPDCWVFETQDGVEIHACAGELHATIPLIEIPKRNVLRLFGDHEADGFHFSRVM